MGDATIVSGRDGVSQCHSVLENRVEPHAASRNELRERCPVDQLHGEEARPRALLDRVQDDDVRVVERRDGPRLALKAAEPLGVGGQLRRQHLERHLAPELRVLLLVDGTQAAFAQLGGDPVVKELPTDHAIPHTSSIPAFTSPSRSASTKSGEKAWRSMSSSRSPSSGRFQSSKNSSRAPVASSRRLSCP